MCSYDRSDRFKAPKQRTLPKVCPNTYYLPDLITKHREGFAPFLSYASRQDKRADRRDSLLPSAADYFPPSHGKRVQGGASLSYTDTRFKYKAAEGPCPGDYDLKSPREIADERKREPFKGRGKLYQCHMPYSLGDSPPSIPHRTNCHGYVVGQHNALKANPPSFHDVTRGPAFYEAEKCCEFTCDRYKGNQWSKYTAKRPLGVGKEGPGPADYDVYASRPNPAREQDELIRFYKRKCSKQPRLLELLEKNTLRENIPGPGHYDIPFVGKKKKKRGNFAFLSSDQRFKYSTKETPAPGSYDLKLGLCQEKPGSLKPTPFLKDALRFPKQKIDNTPGPASYHVPGMGEMLQIKLASRYVTRVPGFNSCAERDLNFAPKEAALVPAPNAYEPKPIACIQCPRMCTAVFKSRTRRLASLQDNLDDATGLASRHYLRGPR